MWRVAGRAAGPIPRLEEPAPSAPPRRRALDLRACYAQSPRVARLLEGYAVHDRIDQFTVWQPTGTPACD